MINSTLEIPSSPQKNPCNQQGCTLLNRRFSGYQLEISREENGRLRGWVTTNKTREKVKLRGLPTYLNLKRATQLLKQSYLKFQKGAIEVLPRGLGGMKRKHVNLEQEALQKPKSSVSDIDSLVEAISNEKEKEVIRKAVKMLLEKDPKEKALGLRNKEIGVLGVQALSVALQVNHTLQILDLGDNQIGDAGAQAIGVVLQVNQSIQELNIGNNRIGEKGARAIGAALQVNQTLQSLNFRHNPIGTTGAQVLADALQVNQSLQLLDLHYNRIGDTGTQALGTALQVNQSIQILNFHGNEIGDVGAQALGTALQVNHTLQSLNLFFNQIGNAGVQALGTALQVNQSIQALNLQGNKIGDAGIQALAKVLQVNQSIQTLNFQSNKIGDAGTQALAEVLQVNQSLQTLDLSMNRIGVAGAQALGIALQVNHTLQVLNLRYNHIGDVGTEALGIALQVNYTLQVLNLNSNQISETGAQILIAALQVNQSLQMMDLGRNQINAAEMNKIETLLQANKQIATLFQQQIKQVQNFLQLHQSDKGLLQNLPQLQELLAKWHTGSKNIIPSLNKILRQSGRTNLNDRYKEKLEGIITNLTNRLHDLWFESFEKKVVALSNKYVMSKKPSEKRNVELGYALYETWLTFLGSDCPSWVEDHLQSFIPFGVLLDIAEGGRKKDVTDLKDAHSLFERVLSFKNEPKDSLFNLTTQSQKS